MCRRHIRGMKRSVSLGAFKQLRKLPSMLFSFAAEGTLPPHVGFLDQERV